MFPHMPFNIIMDDLRHTHSLEVTIENVLEGNIAVPSVRVFRAFFLYLKSAFVRVWGDRAAFVLLRTLKEMVISSTNSEFGTTLQDFFKNALNKIVMSLMSVFIPDKYTAKLSVQFLTPK